MVDGDREFLVGLKRDPVFGPVVAFGLGGVLTEVLERRRAGRGAPLATARRPSYPV